MQQTAPLKAGDRISATVIGDFGPRDNVAGVHVYLRRTGAQTSAGRPDIIPLLSSGPVAMYPPGSANTVQTSSIDVSGFIPQAVVGGNYTAAYAVFFFKDTSRPVTVVSIDPDRDFSRTIVDDPSSPSGSPTITDID